MKPIFPILVGLFLSGPLRLPAEILVNDGQTVAFLGDSITAAGATFPGGYVRLVESGLKANGISITVIPAGIGGHKSDQMLARLQRDVLDKKPAWMTLSCGVNDVWHQEKGKGILLPEYEKNILELVDKAQAAGVKVMILTATLIGEDLEGKSNRNSIAYNEFLRQLAKERNLPLADLNTDMRKEWQAIQSAKVNRKLTRDGVHMNIFGNLLMARGVLKAFGLDEAQMEKAEDSWRDLPGTISLTATGTLSLGDWELLEKHLGHADVNGHLQKKLQEILEQDLAAAKSSKPK